MTRHRAFKLSLRRFDLFAPVRGWRVAVVDDAVNAGTIPSQAWPTGQCPLCAGGVPLTVVVP
jgi:hypothetical protein